MVVVEQVFVGAITKKIQGNGKNPFHQCKYILGSLALCDSRGSDLRQPRIYILGSDLRQPRIYILGGPFKYREGGCTSHRLQVFPFIAFVHHFKK